MKKSVFFAIGIIIFLISGCTDKIINNVVDEFPIKLYPYETIYDSATFQQRRDDLMDTLPANSIALLVTNDLYLRNGDVNYEFRPASNFYYLTGFEEPNAIAVIRKNGNATELIMFVEAQRYGVVAQWIGTVVGPEGAVDYFGADSAYTFEEFGSKINTYLNSGLYGDVYTNLEANVSVTDSFYNEMGANYTVIVIDDIVDAMRVIKYPLEISLLEKAVDVSVQAFSEALPTIKPGMYEYEVEAMFDYVIGLNGCPRTSFPTIVASGPNINILHYQSNQRQMQDGDLVMIDFGAEYGYYAADITRTLPVNGSFNTQQKIIYEIVLEAHQAAINAAAPGVSYYYLYGMARELIIDRLIEKGIITGNTADIIANYTYRQYIPAGLGHCVGLDVHDPFPRDGNNDKILRENMVLAFEPHIYLYANDTTVDADYWGVCARIEDVIRITSTGAEILSSDLPMSVSGIESLMNQ